MQSLSSAMRTPLASPRTPQTPRSPRTPRTPRSLRSQQKSSQLVATPRIGTSDPSVPLYNATVQPGNGSELIKRALAARPWWHLQSPLWDNAAETFHLWWGSSESQPFDWSAFNANLHRSDAP